MPLHALIKIHIALSLIFATLCQKTHCPADITSVSVSFKKDLRGLRNLHELPAVGGLVVHVGQQA